MSTVSQTTTSSKRHPAAARPQGIVLWRGPSAIDGAPIVVVATGFRRVKNPKTGPMIQTWILRDDVSPVSAIYSGADVSICGDCPLRGKLGRGRACYVAVHRAPQAVWKAYKAGRYVEYSPREHNRFFRSDPRKAYVALRLGAYGDPAAAPYTMWASLCRLTKRWTGYTHQWREPKFYHFRKLCMASVETTIGQRLASSGGWRTFRCRSAAEPLLPNEYACPAAAESGARTQCMSCGACCGTRFGQRDTFKSLTIIAHGGRPILANFDKLER